MTTTTPDAALAPPAGSGTTPHVDPHHARRWLILGVLGLAQLMVVLDATIVNIALPAAQKSLGFSNNDRTWVVTGYALAFGSLLLLGGRLSDLLGRKRLFLIALGGFAVASAIGGAANGFTMLVAARALQGIFGAFLAPSALALLTTTFVDPKERNKAFGIFGAIAGAGGALGLLLGGILTSYLSWRWCLYVNLIFAAVAIAGGVLLLTNSRPDNRAKLDLRGAVTISVGLFAIVFGLSRAEIAGWGSASTITLLVVGVLLVVAFAALQLRTEHPLLPVRVLLDRMRGGSYLSVFISAMGMFTVFLFLTYYLEATRGYSAVRTGVAFLPMIAALAISAQVANIVLMPRVGPKVLVPIGMILGAIGLGVMAQITLTSHYYSTVLPAILIMGLGMGMIFAPAMQGAISNVAPHDAGVASAMVNTMQQVGGSIGTALINTIATSAATAFAAAHFGEGLPQQLLLAKASLHSYTVSFWFSAGIFVVGAIIAATVLPRGTLSAPAEGAPVLAH